MSGSHPRPARTFLALGVGLVLSATVLLPQPVAAQGAVRWDPGAAEVTRAELTELLEKLESAATASGYSQRLRNQARQQAEQIRMRLDLGDFQVGDRIALEVRDEPDMSDTLVVASGRYIDVHQVGAIPLDGVLRSELQSHLETELARFLRNPSIRATALIRVGILGSVGRQGFYTVPATVLLEDAIMAAGGPAGRAELNRVSIERGDRVIWSGESVQTAFVEGRTLDQLNLRAGDRIVVPERRPGMFEDGLFRTLLFTVPPLLYLAARFL